MATSRKVDQTFDTGTSDVLADLADGVATITLNRPERRNALSSDLIEALATLLADFESDDGIGAVVITGAGGAFCAGGDVKGFDERAKAGVVRRLDPARIEKQVDNQRATVGKLFTYPKPVIASLPGPAAGAGLGLALSADVRIGSTRTLMLTAFKDVGFSGDYGTAWLLNRLLGPSKARELMFFNEKLHAENCLTLGLLNWLVPDDQLELKTQELAIKLAAGPRHALSSMKRNLVIADRSTLDESMLEEVPLHQECGLTAEHQEAVAAFVEKRAPRFTR